MKKNTIKLACFLLVLVLSKLNAQLSGPYTVPGSYASIGLAIADLNTQGVSGAVTINIAAGHTETATVGGYTLNSITGASATNSIVIQKSGAGANPIVYAYAGGAGTPATAVQDGVIRFVGTDFVTIDGIDINDPNTANPATMEFGYGFFKASVTDGCQNNTIKNCVITLNRINNVAGTAPAVDGSRGIDVVNATTGAHTTILTITSAAGANSNNKFYSNTIQNCNVGIALIGFAAATPFTLADTGNDIGGSSSATGNTIINFGGGGTTSAAAGIRTLAQYGINVAYNMVNNNNGSGVNHAADLRGIYINTATSANGAIHNNTITLQSAGTTAVMTAIHNVSGSTAASNVVSINNNLITNCTYTSAATSAVFNGILNAGTPATLTINGNMISSITLSTTGTCLFIEAGSPVYATCNTNTITNVNNAAASGTMRLLKCVSPTDFIANGNLLDGVHWTSAASTGNTDGFYSLSSPINVSLINNVVRNFSTPSSGTLNGLREFGTAGNKIVQNNQVYNFTTGTGGIGGGTFNGIYLSTGTQTISGNTVYSLNSTGTTGGAGGAINGIWVSGNSATRIYKNRIYDLSSTSTVGIVSGINVSGGSASTIYNNLVGGLSAPASIGANVVMGLNLNSGTALMVYYNTVNLNGTSTSSLSGSSALLMTTGSTLDLRNNILINRSTPTGTGVTAAYRRTSTTLTSYSVSSNNNLFYAGTPGAANVIYTDGTSTSQTMSLYKTFMVTRDMASVTENPTFVSTVGGNANFLNINIVTPTQIEGGAVTVTGISDDYAGTVRNATTPDIGAWEGTYVFADMTPVAMSGSGFTTPACITTGRTFTASLFDASGIGSGALAPRIYYRLNAGAYTSVSGTLTSGTSTNGVWTFSMTYAGTISDIVSYFVVVQDAAGIPNVTSFPTAGFVGTDVNTITSNPTSPNTYGINALNGVYTVGASGTFTSLTAASIAYNTYCLTGPVTFSLTDALYSTAETYPIVFLNNPDASATNSLLIRPATGLAVALTPTNTTISSVIKFLNARYITMDGLNTGGSSLAVNNANVSSVSANIWLSSSGTGNNFIGIKNLALKGGYTSGSNGIIAGVDGVNPAATGGVDNDNITISGNTFETFYQGILALGSASITAGAMDNWSITTNTFGPVATGTANIAGNAVVMLNAMNVVVTGNTVRNIVTSQSGVSAINMNSNITGLTVSQNTITNIYSSSTGAGVNSIAGIYLGLGVSNGTVNANLLSTIASTTTSGYAAKGIIINTDIIASNLNVRNNMISNIYCYADVDSQYWPVGISVNGTGGGINIDFNTVNISGSYPAWSSATGGVTGSAALHIVASGGNMNIRNNIFSNTYNASNFTADINYAVYSAVSNTNFVSMNYNDYYVGGTGNNPVLGFLTANQANLLGIQTAFGGNLNSVNANPIFVSNTDLHMQAVPGNIAVENTGNTLAGITNDFDSQLRSLTTPDIGADEFTIPTCTNALGGTIAPTSTVVCVGQTLTATSTGVSTGLNTVYQWEAAATPGGPYGNIAGGSGATTPSYTSGVLSAGVFYVRLKTTCTTMTAASNEVTVTVNALPTATAGATSATICEGQNISLNGSGTGTTYTWTGPNSYSSTTQNPVISSASPTISGSYSLVSTSGACSSTISTVSVIVNPFPKTLTVTPASATICAGGSQTLTALGGASTPTLIWGTQANQNTASTAAAGYPAPYSVYYGGQRMQILVLASELFAAGFIAGSPITSVQFPVVSKAANWGVTMLDNQNFQVNIGNTNLASLTAFQSGLTNVVAPMSFTPVVGYTNMHTFASPYIWNGSSNIILETTFSNNYSGTAADLVVQYNTPTSFPSTVVYRGDSQTAAAIASITTVSYGYSARPDFRLNGTAIGTMSWTPSTGLSTTTGNSVIASPAVSTNYTITASYGSCTTNTSVAITISAAPAVSIVATPTAVCAGDATTLTASGATSYTWDPTNMTNTISVSPSVGTTIYTVTAQSGNCAAVTETISIVSNALPVVQASSNPVLVCSGQSATLTGSGATTYAWVSGPSTNTYVVSPTSGTSYTVTGTDANGCSDDAVVTVATGSTPVVAVSPVSQSVCATTLATFTASGANTYSWSSGSTNSILTINSAATNVYTVTGFASTGCSATQTVALSALALPVVGISPASPTVCNNETIVLTADGATTYSWMPLAGTQNTLSVTVSVTTTYSVEGVGANGCKAVKTVIVTMDPCTGVKESSLGGKVNLYPNPSTGLLTAEFGYDGTKNIVVLNSVGAVIMSSTTQEHSASLDLSAFAKGVYFVNVKSNGTSANYKVVIQ